MKSPLIKSFTSREAANSEARILIIEQEIRSLYVSRITSGPYSGLFIITRDKVNHTSIEIPEK